MSTLDLKAYEIFKNKLGEKEAEIVIEYFESKADQKFVEKKDVLATKQDLSETKVDILKWMVGLWIAQIAAIVGLYLTR